MVAPARPCCTTCASSCARSRRPSVVSDAYCPRPKIIFLPRVKALAFIDRAVSSACVSVWMRTWLKSAPKRDSNKLRARSGRGCPAPFIALMPDSISEPISSSLDLHCISGAIFRGFFPISSSPHREAFAKGQVGFIWIPGSGIRITSSATLSASCSYMSFGCPIFSFV